MKFFPKETRSLIGTATIAVICVSGSAAFVWNATQEREAATQLLQKRSEEINRFRNATPPPTKDHAKQLQTQLDAAEATYRGLRTAISEVDKFPLQTISPQEFQKSLNEKAQALLKKAEKEDVKLPLNETEGNSDSFFYLGFKDYKTKPPAPEKAPALNRQLQASELLLNLLLDSHPMAIRKVRLFEPEPLPPPTSPTKPGGKPDPKATAVVPPAPALAAQGFDVQFSARAESLREFLNALTHENRAFFVTRNLKVTNSKEKEPLKKGETAVNPNAVLGGQSAPNAGGDSVGRYVLGDEYVEVEMTIEMLSIPPQAEASATEAPKRP